MQCDCDVCKLSREVCEHLQRVPEADRDFWEGLYLRLDGVETDLDYANAIIEGSWPDADEIIAERRKRLAERQCKHRVVIR